MSFLHCYHHHFRFIVLGYEVSEKGLHTLSLDNSLHADCDHDICIHFKFVYMKTINYKPDMSTYCIAENF